MEAKHNLTAKVVVSFPYEFRTGAVIFHLSSLLDPPCATKTPPLVAMVPLIMHWIKR